MSDTKPGPGRSVSLTWLLGVLCVGLLWVTFAGRLGRYWWIADLFSHFALYYVTAGLILTAVVIVLKRKRLAVLSMVVVMLNAWQLWPQWGAATPTDLAIHGGGELRLVHFNVLRTNRDSRRVIDFLNTCRAEAVFIQEASPWWVTTLREADTPYRVALAHSPERRFGVMMLVRNEEAAAGVGDGRFVNAQLIHVTDEQADRPAIEATFELAGHAVSVLSVHPAQPVNARYTALRDDMLRGTKRWSDRQAGPHVVIGDMNTTPWSYAFSILTEDGGLISSLDGWGNQGTWPTDRPVPWMIPIDHCLFSPGFVCLDRRVGPKAGSDHLPLTVSLSFITADAKPANKPMLVAPSVAAGSGRQPIFCGTRYE